MHIDKPGLLHAALPGVHGSHALAELVGRSVHVFDRFHEALGLVVGAVVGRRDDLDGGNLEPSVGLQVGQSLREQVVVVADETFQLAAVDEVERLAVGPGGFVVVDFEAAVGGDPFHLLVLWTFISSVSE